MGCSWMEACRRWHYRWVFRAQSYRVHQRLFADRTSVHPHAAMGISYHTRHHRCSGAWLHDISEADAIAEGVYPAAVYGGVVESWLPSENMRERFYPTARGAYAALWDSINGAGSWDANPWVMAYTFTVHKMNIDDMRKDDANG